MKQRPLGTMHPFIEDKQLISIMQIQSLMIHCRSLMRTNPIPTKIWSICLKRLLHLDHIWRIESQWALHMIAPPLILLGYSVRMICLSQIWLETQQEMSKRLVWWCLKKCQNSRVISLEIAWALNSGPIPKSLIYITLMKILRRNRSWTKEMRHMPSSHECPWRLMSSSGRRYSLGSPATNRWTPQTALESIETSKTHQSKAISTMQLWIQMMATSWSIIGASQEETVIEEEAATVQVPKATGQA